MSLTPPFVATLVVGYAWGGSNGLYWATGIGVVLWLVGTWAWMNSPIAPSEQRQLEMAEETNETVRETLAAVQALKPTTRLLPGFAVGFSSNFPKPSPAATWHILRRLLHYSPGVSSLTLEHREPVLWRFELEGTLPSSDLEMHETLMRYRATLRDM